MFLVETTSLARADVDLVWEEYEHRLWQAVTELELRHHLRIAVELVDHLDEAETAAWLDAIETAASGNAREVHIVASPVGRVEIRPSGSSMPDRTFVGAVATRDGWRRLGRAVQAKYGSRTS
jgi:hypothetical protein